MSDTRSLLALLLVTAAAALSAWRSGEFLPSGDAYVAIAAFIGTLVIWIAVLMLRFIRVPA